MPRQNTKCRINPMLDLKTNSCPFCAVNDSGITSRVLIEDELSFCIYDGYPVSEGHCLIIPNRHISSFFEASREEKMSLFNILDLAKEHIDKKFSPQGFNIGINDGPAAGQTVPHLHIHLIPRYQDDAEDPRGGIRLIFPGKANYWDKK